MMRFVVISTDPESFQWIGDYVLAESKEAAEKWVEKARGDVADVQACSVEDMREWANELATLTEDDIRKSMEDLADAMSDER